MSFSKKLLSLVLAGTISLSTATSILAVDNKEEISDAITVMEESSKNYIVILKADANVDDFISKLTKLDIEVVERFEVVFKGLTIKVDENEISELKKFEEVSKISEDKVYKDFEVIYNKKRGRRKRDLESLKLIINEKLPEKYDGRGTAVAIIDSGADIYHPDFRLDEGLEKKLTKEAVNKLIQSGQIRGQYINEKIPFVYDYVDRDFDVRENKEQSHGMHVAGIVAGNPEDKKNKSVGVVPNAQLVLMKVFYENGRTQSRLYVKAIEDAIKLNVDSINMSLGSGSGSILMEDPAVITAIEKSKGRGYYSCHRRWK